MYIPKKNYLMTILFQILNSLTATTHIHNRLLLTRCAAAVYFQGTIHTISIYGTPVLTAAHTRECDLMGLLYYLYVITHAICECYT